MRSISLIGTILFVSHCLTSAQANGHPSWEQFKQDYSKKYSSLEDELIHKENFANTLKWIDENQGKNGMQFGVNQFADLSDQEFKSQHTIPIDQTQLRAMAAKSQPQIDLYEALPVEFDWRNHMANFRIEHQGSCGSCWAFATAYAIEAQYAIRRHKTVHLSKQELLDCTLESYDSEYHNQGCKLGNAGSSYNYAIKHGLHEEAEYPYLGKEGLCQAKQLASKPAYKIKQFNSLAWNVSDTEMMAAIKQNGPVVACIGSSDNEFKFLKGGAVMRNVRNNLISDHLLAVIGWGRTAEGVDYWILRNQWGETWGEHGYGYVERGRNMLGINFGVSYPVLE